MLGGGRDASAYGFEVGLAYADEPWADPLGGDDPLGDVAANGFRRDAEDVGGFLN